MASTTYDVIIVGAGIAGPVFAYALSMQTEKRRQSLDLPPLRIALLERSLSEPDRIVGELLQPGGVAALESIGMQDCLEGIDAIPVKGYCIVQGGKKVHIPYPDGREGRSFHHGKFVMSLREKAKQAKGVELIEATVTDLVECEKTKRVLGVEATIKDTKENNDPLDGDANGNLHTHIYKHTFFSELVIISDGCFSNFRSQVYLPVSSSSPIKTITKSHFVGLVLQDAQLPIYQHGTVVLAKNAGPVLLYQIGERDTRILIDVKQPLPSDLKVYRVHFLVLAFLIIR